MTKEEQRAAAARILAKSPLTAEEKQLADMLKKTPEMYIPPRDGKRICGICGAEFEDQVEKKTGEVKISALTQFVDHQAEHNPSPAQWGEAHKRIQDGKSRSLTE